MWFQIFRQFLPFSAVRPQTVPIINLIMDHLHKVQPPHLCSNYIFSTHEFTIDGLLLRSLVLCHKWCCTSGQCDHSWWIETLLPDICYSDCSEILLKKGVPPRSFFHGILCRWLLKIDHLFRRCRQFPSAPEQTVRFRKVKSPGKFLF